MEVLISITSVSVHYLTKGLSQCFTDHMTSHECGLKAYIDEEHEAECTEIFSRSMANSGDQHACTCNTLEAIFDSEDPKIKAIFNSLSLKLFPSMRFKVLLGITYAAKLDKIVNDSYGDENGFRSIGVQILTIDEIGKKIMATDLLREMVFKVLQEAIMDHTSPHSFKCVVTYYEFKYMLKGSAIAQLLGPQISQLESYIEFLGGLCF
jgi:hypothetical protein